MDKVLVKTPFCYKCNEPLQYNDETESFICKCGLGHSKAWENNFKKKNINTDEK